MTTTIGSLDLNAFSDLYSDSNQYFWFEGNATATYGAGVHITLSPDTSFIANPSGQNILMNTDGISLRNGLLPIMTLDNDSLDFNVVDINTSTYTNVASFGSTTTIGISDGTQSYIEVNTVGMDVYSGNDSVAFFGSNARIGQLEGTAKVVVSPDSLTIYGTNNIPAFDSRVPLTSEVGTSTVYVDLWNQGYNIYSTTVHPSGQTSTATPSSNGSVINEISEVVANETFNISIFIELYYVNDGATEGRSTSYTFTKGTNKTYSASNFTFSNASVELRNVRYESSTNTIYYGDYSVTNNSGQNIQSKLTVYTIAYTKHSINFPQTTIQGDCCLNNDSVGATSVQGDIYITTNTELLNAISALGWDEDTTSSFSVITSLSLFNSSYSVTNGGSTYVSASVTPAKEDTIVLWSSSDEGVFTIPSNGYTGSNYHLAYNYIQGTGSSGDTAILTCWINRGGTLVSSTATVTIT